MSKNVLVLGGTGLQGVPTVKLLLKAGFKVQVMSRGRTASSGQGISRPRLNLDKKSFIICDRNNPDRVEQAVVQSGADIVIDFTAMKPEHIDPIVSAHKQRPLKHYLMISTNMVYPGGRDKWDLSEYTDPITESECDLNVHKSEDRVEESYGGRKLRCELMIHQASKQFGLPFTIIRPPAVIGPGCDDRYERCHRLAAGLPSLPNTRDHPAHKTALRPGGMFTVCLADDVASMILTCVKVGERAMGETFNVAQKNPQNLVSFIRSLHDIISGNPGDTKLPERYWGCNYENQGVLSIDKAIKVLGWQPVDWMAGLNETVKWHSQKIVL